MRLLYASFCQLSRHDDDDDLDMIIQQCSRSAFSKKDETPSQQPNNVYKTKENKFLNKCCRG